jgi:anti-sigma regulatory factor (Ser/Thr protein kinase)
VNTSTFERELALSCQLSSVTTGRHFIREVLLEWNLPRLVEDAELGVSELIANAVRYARTDVTLRITVAERVTIWVRDHDPMLRRPISPRVDELAESGRGLRIVATVSDDWGIQGYADGKAIWFTLELPDRRTADAELVTLGRPAAREEHRSQTAHVG